ncbi:hypothetical protein DL766_003029 [Monosporascus sp. MC13-8B]|uniref:Mitochondrial carrier protein pet8 n=1 Tax=Monosporascus cannonballus TaxID=155416 RepID=A0ABY0H702_9PEZI|nr:hypothetical protein DL762_004718 [Monosporascus cannonballus]RYO98769.1 hypothetical protein DL763_002030 [Monosporascus cannonballus]RYP34380.1 hypothetical protein DL766_003029 [Monosporascus sp. MC13-8B]
MASRMLLRTTRPAAGFMASRQAAAAQRTFTSSPASLAYKESSHNDDSRDPEKHKQDMLTKQKEGKGHWKPELASDSEEAIKADRARGRGEEDIAKLQERTKSAAEDTAKSGTSMRDGL